MKGWLFWEHGGICRQGYDRNSCRWRTEKVPLSPPNGAEQQKKWQFQPLSCSSHFLPFPQLSFGHSATKPVLRYRLQVQQGIELEDIMSEEWRQADQLT